MGLRGPLNLCLLPSSPLRAYLFEPLPRVTLICMSGTGYPRFVVINTHDEVNAFLILLEIEHKARSQKSRLKCHQIEKDQNCLNRLRQVPHKSLYHRFPN